MKQREDEVEDIAQLLTDIGISLDTSAREKYQDRLSLLSPTSPSIEMALHNRPPLQVALAHTSVPTETGHNHISPHGGLIDTHPVYEMPKCFSAAHIFKFSSPQQVVYCNSRLGVINMVMRLVIVIFTITQLFLFHKYAQFEIPTALVTSWVDFDTNNTMINEYNRDRFDSTSELCQNQTKWKILPNPHYVNNVKQIYCRYINPMQGVINEANLISIPTLENIVFNSSAANSDVYTNAWFVTNAEDISINFSHQVVTESSLFGSMKLVIKDSNRNTYQEIPGDKGFSGVAKLTTKELLHLANVNLDDFNPQFPFIRQRMSGIVLIVKLKYSNYRDLDLDNSPVCEMTVQHLPGLWAYTARTIYDRDKVHSIVVTHSIQVQFVVMGTLGVFNIPSLFLSLLSSFLLLKVSSTIVSYVAQYCCGKETRTFFKQPKYKRVGIPLKTQ